jgi:hypothetical protein
MSSGRSHPARHIANRSGGWTLLACLLLGRVAMAGPETALREFASSQIKKGVRTLGLGGDGATIGNYSLVYHDAGGAVADYGVTSFSDTGNSIHFVAVGLTTPQFWHGSAFYLIAMNEWASGLALHLTSPQYAKGADFRGEASDQAIFAKFAKPLPRGFAIGGLFGWERSALSAANSAGAGALTYTTTYLPSGGVGASWEGRRLIAGVRALLSNDLETRRDAISTSSGWLRSWEFRAGVAARPYPGTTLDVGYVGLWRSSAVDHTESFTHAIVAGIEQRIWREYLTVRAGWNESSPTFGLSARWRRFKLDAAYVRNLGIERSKGVFGHTDDAVLFTLNYDYARSLHSEP